MSASTIVLGVLVLMLVARAVEVILVWHTRRQVLAYLQALGQLESSLRKGAHARAARYRSELLTIERALPSSIAGDLADQYRQVR